VHGADGAYLTEAEQLALDAATKAA